MPVMMIAVVQSNFVRQATLTAPHPQHPSDRSIAHRSPLTSPLTNFNPGLGVYNISYFCTRTRSGWEEGRERKGKERKGKERKGKERKGKGGGKYIIGKISQCFFFPLW
jgi:hypothetical protein